MNARSCFDSNILVYTDDAGAPEKQARALDLLELCRTERSGVVSTQVLQEYFVTTTRKLQVPAETARRKVEIFGRLIWSVSGSRTSWEPSIFTDPSSPRFGML